MNPPLNRREFLAQATATAALAATASTTAGMGRSKNSLPKSPTEKVALGKSGVQVSLVGMGTGSVGSGQASNQTRLGVQGFTKVVRHALDQGICFFDVADQYGWVAHVPSRSSQGRSSRAVRHPDQDPCDQCPRRAMPPLDPQPQQGPTRRTASATNLERFIRMNQLLGSRMAGGESVRFGLR